MRAMWLVVAVAAVMIGGAGCAAHPPTKASTLPAGTAELSVNGATARVTDTVQCESIEWMRMIKTGDQAAGVTVMLSNANKLLAEFVRFRDFDGFTGSYDRNLQGDAAVAMTGPTYRIAGTAVGYANSRPTERTTAPFELRVSC